MNTPERYFKQKFSDWNLTKKDMKKNLTPREELGRIIRFQNFWYGCNRILRDWGLAISLIISILIPIGLVAMQALNPEQSRIFNIYLLFLSSISLILTIMNAIFHFDHHTRSNRNICGKAKSIARHYDQGEINDKQLCEEIDKLEKEDETENIL